MSRRTAIVDGEEVAEEDFYTFLNIAKDASDDEIANAYRRLSRLYHPDKHLDPERKKEAEILFGKTKRAYEVLIDPHMRAIYDSLGIAGLETQGWEIVQRTKSPHEIREEYERLAREREEHRVQQRTNPKSSVSMTINATDLFSFYDESSSPYADFREEISFPQLEITSLAISQSIEAPLTTKDTAIFSGNLSSHSGMGGGSMSCAVRRVISEKGWGELEVGAGEGISLAGKLFRTFRPGTFGNCSVKANVTPNGIGVGGVAAIANQLDKHTVGYLTWKAGPQSGMSTVVVRDTPIYHCELSLFIGFPHTYCGLSYLYKLDDHECKLKMAAKVGTFGALVEYGAEKKVSLHSTVSAAIMVGVPTGVQLKIKLQRASQTYGMTILLCEELIPAPVIYGTVAPLVAWLVVQRLIVQPYQRRQKRVETVRHREANRVRLRTKRREALAAIELMRETVKRIVEQEEVRKGLVIIQAWYGPLIVEGESLKFEDLKSDSEDIIDVTIPLQCCIKNSKLILQETSKSGLPGFYDPCPGEDKWLLIRYLFRAVIHQVTVKDAESLRIPKQSHKLETV